MKIVHLSTLDHGGAGLSALRLHQGLLALGADSTMLVLARQGHFPGVKMVSTRHTPKGKTPWLAVWERWLGLMKRYPGRPAGLEIFSSATSDAVLAGHPDLIRADVVNLHWVSGLVNVPDMPRLFAGKPLVWTLHDQNPMTGGCHYAMDCQQFKTGCQRCPQLGSDQDDDLAAGQWNTKARAYEPLSIQIMAPSEWMAEQARQSALLGQFPVSHVPNGISLDIFSSLPAGPIRSSLGLDDQDAVLLFGAYSHTLRKGSAQIRLLLERLPTSIGGRRLRVVTFGNKADVWPDALPATHLGLVDDPRVLAGLYSMADAYVLPTLADNLPNTVIEALACGLPTIGFDVGGMPDLVKTRDNGWLAPVGDIDGLIAGIEWAISRQPRDREAIVAGTRKRYALKIQAMRYMECYTALAQGRENRPVATHASAAHADRPFLSIITPVLNGAAHIQRCLEAVISQGCRDVEHIIMDGGSTDGTQAILADYASRYGHIRWQSGKDSGQSQAMNQGVTLARADVISFLNVDDVYEPGVFDRVRDRFASLTKPSLMAGNCRILREDGDVYINRPATLDYYDLLLERGELPFNPSAYFYHKRLHDLVGPYDEKEHYVMDADFLLRALPVAHAIHVDEIWGTMHYLPTSKTFLDNVAGNGRKRLVRLFEKHKRRLRISFIIPAYNYAHHLTECVASIYNGNFQDGDEVIIVDDASTDDTVAVAERLAVRYPALRVLRHARNKGSANAGRNTGTEQAQNELLFYLDADNVLAPGSIPRLKEHLLACRADAAAFGELRFFTDEVSKPSHSWFFPNVITFHYSLYHPREAPGSSGNYLLTRTAWHRAGRCDESIGGAYDSYAFGLALLGTGSTMVTLPGSWYWHRHGHASAFVRDSTARNPSTLLLRAVLPYLDQLDADDVAYMLSPEGRVRWFDNLADRPRKPAPTPGPSKTDATTHQADPAQALAELSRRGLWTPGTPIKLHLGCGEQYLPGYINIDFPPDRHTAQQHAVADIFADLTGLDYPDGAIEEIRSHHVFEHFDRPTALALLVRWSRWLALRGRLIIETPDVLGSFLQVVGNTLTFPQKQAVMRHIFGSHEASWAVHCDGWYGEKFVKVLEAFGFKTAVHDAAWERPPWLHNTTVVAVKARELDDATLMQAVMMVHSWHMVDGSPCEVLKLENWTAQTARAAGIAQGTWKHQTTRI